jgi:UDP-glucose 4-epimerase
VVVTGGAGFIGSHLCDALLARGDQVTCVDNLIGTRGSTRNVDHLLEQPGFRLEVEDVLEWAGTARLRGVDSIFHQAASKNSVALEDPERDLRTNALATLRLLSAAARQGVRRFIHASTGSVFGETTARHTEDAPKHPVSLYGISKLAGESYCQVVGETFGLDCSVLRYYHVIGPRQDGSDRGGVVPIFARRCLAGKPVRIYGSGEQTRSFTSVHDVVRANLMLAASPAARGRSFNCASGVTVTIRELAEFVMTETGTRRPIEFAPERPGDIRRFDVDNSRLLALGLEFDRDWRALVREVIDSERQLAGRGSERAAEGSSQRGGE